VEIAIPLGIDVCEFTFRVFPLVSFGGMLMVADWTQVWVRERINTNNKINTSVVIPCS